MPKVSFHKANLEYSKSFLLTMLLNKKLVGDALVSEVSRQEWSIDEIGIQEPYQGRGYGRILVDHIEELASRSKILVVRLHSFPDSVGFWLALGYHIGPFDIYKDINPTAE